MAAYSLPSDGRTTTARCPRCRVAMTVYTHGGVALDLCQQCMGLWFDAGELARIEAVQIDPLDSGDSAVQTPTLPCPRCSGRLEPGQITGARGFRLQQCGRCGGVWLTAGQLQRIREIKTKIRSDIAARDAEQLREFQKAKERDRALWASRDRAVEFEYASASSQSFFTYLLDLPSEEDGVAPTSAYATYALMLAVVAVWLWQLAVTDAVWIQLSEVANDILAGRHLYTLATAMFIHGGWCHVLGNLYFLWMFGDDVEERLGSARFLAWYFVWGLAASLLSITMMSGADRAVHSLGASGAIAGALGAYLVLFPQRRLVVAVGFNMVAKLPAWCYLVFWIGLQFVSAAAGVRGIGWWAHIGGFFAGVSTAWWHTRSAES